MRFGLAQRRRRRTLDRHSIAVRAADYDFIADDDSTGEESDVVCALGPAVRGKLNRQKPARREASRENPQLVITL